MFAVGLLRKKQIYILLDMHRLKTFFFYLYRIHDLDKRYLYLIFAMYVILLCLAVSRHEPWLDEAQPWILATDFGVGELLGKYLRYEGHPALWYLILFIPAKLGLPYFTLNVISAALAVLAQWLFLRHAPFPLIVKILLPFTFFAFYQYAVIARSYCLIPPLLFLIAVRYKRRMEQPLLYSLLLCLFANISAHTLLIAGILMFLHLTDVLKIWSKLDKGAKTRQICAAALFTLSSLQMIYVLLPPADQAFAVGTNWGWLNFYEVAQKMIAGSLVADETAGTAGAPQILFSLVVVAATLVLLRQRRLTLLYLLPLLALLGFLAVKYNNVWHTGILFYLWIFVLWIRFADERDDQPLSKTGKLVLGLMTVVLAVQVYWGCAAALCDFRHDYSGSYRAARYLRENRLENAKIYMSGWKAVAIQPYFDGKIFYNLNQNTSLRTWFWSSQNRTPVGFGQHVLEAVKAEQPAVVVIASDHLDGDPPEEFEGYQLAASFEGRLCWKAGTFEPDSFWIYRRSEPGF